MAIQNWPKTATSSDWANVDSIKWPEAMLPPDVNDSARAMGRDLAKWRDDLNSTITSTGSSNAYVITSNGSYGSLANGFQLSFKANFSNTAAATLNVDSLGAKAIRKFTSAGEAALSANDIVSGGHYWVQYNTALNGAAGAWCLLNPSTAYVASTGLAVSTNNRLIGRGTSGAGASEEITISNGLTLTGTTLTGKIQQIVSVESGSVSTGTTVIPADDTIPQNTEGDQYLSLAITPISASSTIIIDATVIVSANANVAAIAALFQDSTASALAASINVIPASGNAAILRIHHKMTSGTTSSTTFKVRVGPSSSATITFNGSGGSRLFGGVMASTMTITEVLP